MEYIVLSDQGASVDVYRKNTAGGGTLVGSAAKPAGHDLNLAYVGSECEAVFYARSEQDEASGKYFTTVYYRSAISGGDIAAPVAAVALGGIGDVKCKDMVACWNTEYGGFGSTLTLSSPFQSSTLNISPSIFGAPMTADKAVPAICADGSVRLVVISADATIGYISTDIRTNPVTVDASFTVAAHPAPGLDPRALAAALMKQASAQCSSPFVVAGSAVFFVHPMSGAKTFLYSGQMGHSLESDEVENVQRSGAGPNYTYTYYRYAVDTGAFTAVLMESAPIERPTNAYYAAPPIAPPFWTALRGAYEV